MKWCVHNECQTRSDVIATSADQEVMWSQRVPIKKWGCIVWYVPFYRLGHSEYVSGVCDTEYMGQVNNNDMYLKQVVEYLISKSDKS